MSSDFADVFHSYPSHHLRRAEGNDATSISGSWTPAPKNARASQVLSY